jgi:spoIIIJ-associated protein
MATQPQEFKAKSVEEAVEEGLNALGVTRDAVDIEIVNKGSRGIFGIGSEPAVVRLTLRSAATAPQEKSAAPTAHVEVASATTAAGIASADATIEEVPATAVDDDPVDIDGDVDSDALAEEESADSLGGVADEEAADNALVTTASEDELADLAADLLHEMIHLMGFKATVTPSWQEEEDDEEDEMEEDEQEEERATSGRRRYLLLDVEGTDLGALIGRRGETLENIQYLLRLMVNQKIYKWKNIVVDIEHYKERRMAQLTQLANRMAEQVARSGRPISLEPMPANERRIVHMVLRSHPDVYTESYGEGARRKVHIFARD